MKQFVWEVLAEVKTAKKKEEKIKILKDNRSWALLDIIRGSLDSSVQWDLPQGPVPFTRCDPHNAPSNLMRQNKQFTYFVKGGQGDQIKTKAKKEQIFIGLLEGIHPNDADLVVSMINKKKIPGISKALIDEAFPGLIKE